MELLRKAVEISALIAFVSIISKIECVELDTSMIPANGCQYSKYPDIITCIGDFNFSTFWQTELSHQVLEECKLQIANTSLQSVDETTFAGNGSFAYETILIENAPKLKYIHPKAFILSKNMLTEFRALNTSLSATLGDDEFATFTNLQKVYVGEQSHCPEDSSILFPCTCRFGNLGKTTLDGLYGSVWSRSGALGKITAIDCASNQVTGTGLSEIFSKLSTSNHSPKYFDKISVEGSNITSLPPHLFHNVTFGRIRFYNVPNLTSIHLDTFWGQYDVQAFEMEAPNFTASSESETHDIFNALKSMKNLRIVRLSSCGIPFIPGTTNNETTSALMKLRVLSISFDRRKHTKGVTSVGSYAFAWAPNLKLLGLSKNYISYFAPYAFGFHSPSENGLQIDIGVNPFNDSNGLAPMAFSGAQRQVNIKFDIDSFAGSDPANDPALNYFPENVFRPFLEENVNNTYSVDYYNVNVYCDCASKWMFEDSGLLTSRVRNGLQIKRIEGSLVDSDFSSIQCKPQSSFECLPNCLIFEDYELLHFGKYQDSYNINNTEYNISRLLFSAKNVTHLDTRPFENSSFTHISLIDCLDLESIHPEAFAASFGTLKHFTATNTSLKIYPNFANFRNLSIARLDSGYNINSSNFDYSAVKDETKIEDLTIYLGAGKIHPSTFSKLNKERNITLAITENVEYFTIGEILRCTPTKLELERHIFKPFLEVNPGNKIITICYLECSCAIKWMKDEWNDIKNQVRIWDGFQDGFSCVRPGANITSNFDTFRINSKEFQQKTYFKENC